MKANEAPEKIYITNYDIPALPKEEQLSERWYEVSTQDTDIEYTRTDAFIKKTCEWLRLNLSNYFDDTRETFDLFIDDFRKYIKEE